MFEDPLGDDERTPVACGACGGAFMIDRSGVTGSYALVACRWCNRGAQTAHERARWERHRKRWRDSGARRRQATPGIITGPVLAEDTKRFR